jgi:hypothetical protein
VIQLASDETGVKVFNGSQGAANLVIDANGWFD